MVAPPHFLHAAALLALVSCGPEPEVGPRFPPGSKPVVHATSYPLFYFAERICGDLVDLRFLAPPDEDPAFWNPSDEQVALLQGATLILRNGAGYEKWMEQVTLPEASLVDTSAGFKHQFIEEAGGFTHSHGKDGEHSHAGTAFTTWIDFSQAKAQAEAVADALAKLLPESTPTIQSRSAALLADIDGLDREMSEVAGRIGSRPLVGSHPVYQYFARRYGLSLQAVHWEPETVPDAAALEELKTLIADHPAAWMIWEGEPASESVALLDGIGVKSVIFDPCGNRPEEGDWLEVMRANIANLTAIQP